MYNNFNNMNINAFRQKIKITISCLAVSLFTFSAAQAANQAEIKIQDKDIDPASDSTLSVTMKKEAMAYRAQGVEQQRAGNLEAAMSFYQKALQFNPIYAAPYNDLGIIYEANGDIERAGQSYLKAITIDPNYTSAYSNLALLYENNRDLDKAAYYWGKRVELGDPADPWTEKARQRPQDIKISLAGSSNERENNVLSMVTDVNKQKELERTDDKALANKYLNKARQLHRKGDNSTALKVAIDAQQLDPTNDEIEKFIEDLQLRILSH
ncbi:MAG: tetratricopeptide repeat protein [Candidatus Omnitrophota bacterium]